VDRPDKVKYSEPQASQSEIKRKKRNSHKRQEDDIDHISQLHCQRDGQSTFP
jgi:hypothetical protein